MKIVDIINEVLDVSKMKETQEIQKTVAKLTDFVAKNPAATKDIAGDPMALSTNFQAILTAFIAQQDAAEKEKKLKEAQDKARATQEAKAGVGSTIPVQGKPAPAQLSNQNPSQAGITPQR